MNPKAFYKLSYGLYLITSRQGDKLNGYVANTAFQVTAEPSRVAISCHKDNLSSRIITENGFFAISVLKQDAPMDLIGTFGYKSGKDIDKFEGIAYQTGKSGVPIVTDHCVAWFECKVVQATDVGTHILFIGEVLDGELLDEKGEPLTYAWYQQEKNGKAPKNAPTYQKPEAQEKETAVQEEQGFKKYECLVCGYVYDEAEGDPDSGIPPGTRFEDLPDDWVCPTCGAEKSDFEEI